MLNHFLPQFACMHNLQKHFKLPPFGRVGVGLKPFCRYDNTHLMD